MMGSNADSLRICSDAGVDALTARARLQWVDYTKGIAIALVVLGHVNIGLISAGLPDEWQQRWLSAIDEFIYSFHMPVFFFVGGLFADRLRTRPAAASVVSMARLIVYPYLVWATIQNLLMLLLQSYANHKMTVGELFSIFTTPPMQFWFLYVYFLIEIIYLLLAKAGVPKAGILLFFAALWMLRMAGTPWSWVPWIELQTQGIYFALGDFLRPNIVAAFDERSKWSKWWLPGAAIGFVLLGLLNSVAVVDLWLQLLCALLGIASTCCLAAFLAARKWDGLLRLCGLFSLEIYVMHTIVSAGVRIGLVHVLKIESVYVHIGLGFLAGLAIPALVAYCSRGSALEWLFRVPAPKRAAH
jgi:fucose 4-O-acetylase-like acetyltransferase